MEKLRQKERQRELTKIRDLERQVKELENIIKKRHPNSIASLMWAASSEKQDNPNLPSVKFLEERCKRLEKELEEKDEEEKKSIRVLEQKFERMRGTYETTIEDLNDKLNAYSKSNPERPHTHMKALERELDSVKERYGFFFLPFFLALLISMYIYI